MVAWPQALEVIFEAQRKKNNEKITRRKKQHFNLQNMFFSSFEPLLLSNPIIFFF
jgi:hypothetical protein